MDPVTLPFETFWGWLTHHPNCILRAGTPEAVIYDDDHLHWSFVAEGPGMLVAQLLRGKRLVGEVLIEAEQVTFVQGTPGDLDGEFTFELISETESESVATYFFVLTHGYDEGEDIGAPVH